MYILKRMHSIMATKAAPHTAYLQMHVTYPHAHIQKHILHVYARVLVSGRQRPWLRYVIYTHVYYISGSLCACIVYYQVGNSA
jgi:hypothetical protein